MHGGVGWQGIIPSRAAKMGSIAVDKGIAKLGSPAEFYQQLEPDKIAEHIIESSRDDMHDVVERIMEREHPRLWNDVPARVREAVHARVQEQLPDIVHEVTDEIGTNIDQLLDVKLMVIRASRSTPSSPTGSSSRSAAGSCASWSTSASSSASCSASRSPSSPRHCPASGGRCRSAA